MTLGETPTAELRQLLALKQNKIPNRYGYAVDAPGQWAIQQVLLDRASKR